MILPWVMIGAFEAFHAIDRRHRVEASERLFIGPESTLHGTDFTASSPEEIADGKVRVAVLVPVAPLPINR